MSGEDKRYLNGTRLSEVWAKVKSHVTSSLQGWDGRNTTASGTHTSNITHVGTIAYGTWQGTAIAAGYIGSSAKGQLLYGNGSNVMALLGIGTAGQFLKVVDGAPAWSDLPTAGSTASGIVTTTNQTFAGVKTFTSNMYVNNIYPNSTNTYELGDDAHQFSIIRVNSFLTNGANGFRFGANNGNFRFYGTKEIASMTNDTLVLTVVRTGNMTLHKGSFSVSAGNVNVTNTDANIKTTPSGSGEAFAFGASSNGGYIWGYTQSKAYMRFKNGYVGVFNDSPSCALDVTGDIKASGGVAAGGIADLNLY